MVRLSMNRKKFSFKNGAGQSGKIARDNFLEGTLHCDSSAKISYKYLTGQDLQVRLLEKLIEETTEVCDAGEQVGAPHSDSLTCHRHLEVSRRLVTWESKTNLEAKNVHDTAHQFWNTRALKRCLCRL